MVMIDIFGIENDGLWSVLLSLSIAVPWLHLCRFWRSRVQESTKCIARRFYSFETDTTTYQSPKYTICRNFLNIHARSDLLNFSFSFSRCDLLIERRTYIQWNSIWTRHSRHINCVLADWFTCKTIKKYPRVCVKLKIDLYHNSKPWRNSCPLRLIHAISLLQVLPSILKISQFPPSYPILLQKICILLRTRSLSVISTFPVSPRSFPIMILLAMTPYVMLKSRSWTQVHIFIISAGFRGIMLGIDHMKE